MKVLKIICPALVLAFIACKKDYRLLGVDVQPGSDNINATILRGKEVYARNLPYDSIATSNDKYKFIGSNNDPYFGRTDIGLYLNMNISGTDLNFKTKSKLTSAEIVLALDANQFAGDANAVLTYSVYAMNKGLNTSEIYFTSDRRHHDPNALPVSVHTTSYTITDAGRSVIKIKLDNTYAESLFYDSLNLVNNETFQAKYKGYYIAASLQSGSEGVIYKANLEDDLSGVFVHYKPDPAKDSILDFRFTFTGSSASRYNTVKFSPVQALKDQFADSAKASENIYLKGLGMAKAKIYIPFLKQYKDTFKVAVNRAELILNVDPAFNYTGVYPPPIQLSLLSADDLNRETYLADLVSITDYARYDGSYDATNKRYVFNLAREAQMIFDGEKKNNGFYLVVADADMSTQATLLGTIYAGSSKELLTVRRDNYYQGVVLAGSNNMALKPSFNLSYVNFKKD